MPDALPIHFLTIVLNGQPFIRHHLPVFQKLSCPWHWHIVEGLAQHVLDTAWCARNGGQLPASLHREGLSHDGTSEYLDELKRDFPGQISIYRPPPGKFWEGKLAMVNAPLPHIRDQGLLWQVDSDELWTTTQIEQARKLFAAHPEATAAYYLCDYFFGPEIASRRGGVFGNFANEWLRTWRFVPGDRWTAHEPPTLARLGPDGQWRDLAQLAPLARDVTAAAGLVFQHFAYATEAQAEFKDAYYGYRQAVARWRQLQAQPSGARVRRFLPWVEQAEIGRARTLRTLWRKSVEPWRKGARAELVRARGVTPLAQRRQNGEWKFFSAAPPADHPRTVLLIRTDRIGDNILSTALLSPLHRAWPATRLLMACPSDVAGLYEASPDLDGLIAFDRERGHREAGYRRSVIRRLREVQADLVVCPQFTRDRLTNKLCLGMRARKLVGFAGEITVQKWSHTRYKRRYDRAFTQLIDLPDAFTPELEKARTLLRTLGIAAEELQPAIVTGSEHEAYASDLLKRHGLESRPLIALFAGTAARQKQYPRFGESLRAALTSDHALVTLGAAEDAAINQEVLNFFGGGVNLSGRTSLAQAAAFLRRCQLAVGVDTGLAHLASAVGCRNVVVLGGGHFGRFFPYSPLTTVVALPMKCYQCKWNCRFAAPLCIVGIEPATVAAAIRQSLTQPSDRPVVLAQSQLTGPGQDWLMRDPAQCGQLAARGWLIKQV
jgi:ADP-heptose:LPS heptosyltransferase